MSEDEASALVPIAADLVCVVRDEGPDAVAEVLARVPNGRIDALAVVLAAMVDPDATVGDLLAWTEPAKPAAVRVTRRYAREHGTMRGYRQHETWGDLACAPCRTAHAEARARYRASRKAA